MDASGIRGHWNLGRGDKIPHRVTGSLVTKMMTWNEHPDLWFVRELTQMIKGKRKGHRKI